VLGTAPGGKWGTFRGEWLGVLEGHTPSGKGKMAILAQALTSKSLRRKTSLKHFFIDWGFAERGRKGIGTKEPDGGNKSLTWTTLSHLLSTQSW